MEQSPDFRDILYYRGPLMGYDGKMVPMSVVSIVLNNC